MEQPTQQQTERSPEPLDTSPTPVSEQLTGSVSLSEAARLTGASRNRLYRAIEAGKITRSTDGSLTVQSLLDAGFEFKNERSSATSQSDHFSHLLNAYTDVSKELNESLRDQNDTLREQCAMLQEQLRMLQEQLRASQQRESHLWQLVQPAPAAAPAPAPHVTNDAPRNAPPDVSPQTHVIPFDAETPGSMSEPTVQQTNPVQQDEASAEAMTDHHSLDDATEAASQSGSLFKRWK